MAWRAAGLALVLLAVGIRVHNALTYPPDWGFDASFNWRYIYRLSQDWQLPDPAAGWSTGDPPLYFSLAAATMSGLEAVGARDAVLAVVPLLGTLAGLASVALAVALVRRLDPAREGRAWLAAGLLLFLPAHVHMCVMVNEEILGAFFVSLAAFLLARERIGQAQRDNGRWRDDAAVGAAGGLALLSKLTGATALATACLTRAVDGWRGRRSGPALRGIAVIGLVALAAGGWYYLRNLVLYGYVQPFGLPAHEVMFSMPPGARSPGDYLRLPLATWTDPQLLNPDLLRSVWGSTFATLWFDGHRAFLPVDDPAVSRWGTATLLLALLPTAAFAVGLAEGVRRSLRMPESHDLPLLLLVGVTLAGYTLYTWRNPWFVVLKGTALLGLSLPFAVYASEPLERWLRRGGVAGWAVGLALAGLVVCVAATTTFDGLFQKTEVSGLPWQEAAAP